MLQSVKTIDPAAPTRERQALERRLASLAGRGEAILFGRARAALAALLEVTGDGGLRQSVLPATICPVVYTVLWDGESPVTLADIDVETGLSGDAAMATLVGKGFKSSRPGIVVPTHLYGFVTDYPLTVDAARKSGWTVVEDDAYATTLLEDSKSRPFGDATLISFGAGKTLDAGEGGALLVDDPSLARALRGVEARYPRVDTSAHEAEAHLTEVKRTLRRKSSGPADRPLMGVGEQLLPDEARWLRHGYNDRNCAALNAALDAFAENVASRKQKLAEWRRALDDCGDAIRWPALDQPVPWRAIVRLPEHRDRVVAALRDAKFDAGTNFPSLVEFYPAQLGANICPGAERWSAEVLNLWVSDDYGRSRIHAGAEIVKRALAG
jgi:dTDP-4-amino-4,6-dideoxygalactose transaminase